MTSLSLYERFLSSLEFPDTVNFTDNVWQKITFDWDSPEMKNYIIQEAASVLTYDRHRAYGKHAIDYLEDNFLRGHNYFTNGHKGFAIYTFGMLQVATGVLNSEFPTVNAKLNAMVYQNDFFVWREGPMLAPGLLAITAEHNSISRAQLPHKYVLDLTWNKSFTIDEMLNTHTENSETQIYVSPSISDNGYANYRSLSVFETLKNMFINKQKLKY